MSLQKKFLNLFYKSPDILPTGDSTNTSSGEIFRTSNNISTIDGGIPRNGHIHLMTRFGKEIKNLLVYSAYANGKKGEQDDAQIEPSEALSRTQLDLSQSVNMGERIRLVPPSLDGYDRVFLKKISGIFDEVVYKLQTMQRKNIKLGDPTQGASKNNNLIDVEEDFGEASLFYNVAAPTLFPFREPNLGLDDYDTNNPSGVQLENKTQSHEEEPVYNYEYKITYGTKNDLLQFFGSSLNPALDNELQSLLETSPLEGKIDIATQYILLLYNKIISDFTNINSQTAELQIHHEGRFIGVWGDDYIRYILRYIYEKHVLNPGKEGEATTTEDLGERLQSALNAEGFDVTFNKIENLFGVSREFPQSRGNMLLREKHH